MKTGLLVLGCLATAAHAQPGGLGFFNPTSSSQNGIHLYGVNAYGGYFTGGTPLGLPTVGTVSLPGSMTVAGAAASFGWSHRGDSSSFSASYSPSYIAYPDHTEMNAFGHSFSLNWHKKLGQKWSVGVGASGQINNLQQNFFSPNAYGVAASLPTTFEELAGAVLAGKFTDAQLAATLTGGSGRLLPEQSYLYGQRVLSASVEGVATYTPSGRTSFNISASANRAQSLHTGSTESSSLVPQTTAASASFGWGYSLTPRTHIGADVGTSTTFSSLQHGYASHASVSIGRTMSQRWYVEGRIGGGTIIYTSHAFAAPSRPQLTAGANLGYKLRSHALLASYDRTIGDAYGLGAGSTSDITVGWGWRILGSNWSLSANYGYQRTDGSALFKTESWRASGGIARALSSHVFVTAQYAYLAIPSNQRVLARLQRAQSGVSVGLTWSPSTFR